MTTRIESTAIDAGTLELLSPNEESWLLESASKNKLR